MKDTIEFRIRDTKVKSDGDMIVSGYVNKTEQYSEELGIVKRFKEKISKGSFKRALENSVGDIDFLADHNTDLVLASTKNGTLKLEEDDIGLKMEARIINTSTGRDWFEMISSGLITNMSFGFKVVDDVWEKVSDNLYERNINDLELFEVSAVRTPAYAQSTIASRGLNVADETIIPDIVQKEDKMDNEYMKELVETMRSLTEEMRELRGTLGKDKDGNEVSAQKDNYAVGQLTAEQAENEEDFKRIKEGESLSKYYDDMEIDDKGSYNHDTNVKGVDEEGKQTNLPESETDDRLKEFDGSDPDEVPGVQNHETVEDDSEPVQAQSQKQSEPDKEGTEEKTEGRSLSFDSFERKMRELKGRK